MKEPKDITILIVDDEPALRNAMALDFKRKGFRVLTACNGREGLEMVKAQQVEIVLSDVRMPEGDGVELLRNIKAYSAKIPVVMLITGFADLTLKEAYDQGADAVFPKPFDRKALLEAIMEAVNGKSSSQAMRG